MLRRFVMASLCSTLIGAGSAAAATLDDLQWDYRVVAVFTPTDTAGRETADELSNTVGIAERDIAWFVVSPDALHSNLSKPVERASITALHDGGGFQAVLVGKDGGVKARQSESLDIHAFFDEIDSMPMRQQEMQQQQ
ncbi:DUF4174 domain-containing protein [Salinisphaera sp. C84B14]|uniref:DUF4174 domain-containing protein n=1 Tax=Salinisphaera sp. C84B14 TaxID=1304155 RepID=UPI0033400BE5